MDIELEDRLIMIASLRHVSSRVISNRFRDSFKEEAELEEGKEFSWRHFVEFELPSRRGRNSLRNVNECVKNLSILTFPSLIFVSSRLDESINSFLHGGMSDSKPG